MPSKVQPLTPEFLEEEVSARGMTYHFRELSIGEYDDCVRKATTKRPGMLGTEDDFTDNTVLLRLMVIKASHDPKITDEVLAGLPMRVVMKFNAVVNRMHYGDEPDDEKKKEPAEAEEGNTEGNAA